MESTRNLRIASRSVLLAVVAFTLVLMLPIWPYSSSWSYYPALAAAIILVGLGAIFFHLTPRRL